MFTQRNISLALLALLTIVAGLSVMHAEARVRPPIITACPEGNFVNDGCAASALIQYGEAAAFQIGVAGPSASLPSCWASNGAANQISGTTASYTTNPTTLASTGQGTNVLNYNSPGCEYAIANWTPVASLADPAPGGVSAIPGCAMSGTGPGGNAFMLCTSSSVPTYISGYNFGPIAGSHGCISLQIQTSLGGRSDEYVQNNYWVNDGNCAESSGTPVFLSAYSTGSMTIHVLDNYFDGNAFTWPTANGSCAISLSLACSVTIALQIPTDVNGSNIDIERNVFLNFLFRTIVWGIGPNKNIVVCHNYFQGNDYRLGAEHGEMFQPGAGVGSGYNEVCFNNIFQPTAMAAVGEGPWPTNFSLTDHSTNSLLYGDHNVLISAHVGGANGGTLPAPTIAAGTSIATYPQGATTGTMGSGLAVSSCIASGIGSSISGNLWTPYSGQASVGPGGGWNGGTLAAGAQSWGVDLNLSFPTYPVTGFIDDGLGGGSYDGVAGNTLTVTTPGLVNIVDGVTAGAARAATVTGTGVTSTTIASRGTGTGGVGTYAINGAAQAVTSETLNINIPNPYDGGWSAQTTLTCSSGSPSNAVSARQWLDFVVGGYGYGPPPNPSPAALYSATAPVVMTNNLIDDSATSTFDGYNQRNPIVNYVTITATVASGSNQLVVTGISTVFPLIVGTKVQGTNLPTGTMISSLAPSGTGTTGTYTLSANSTGVVTNPGVTNAGCNVPAYFSGNISISGTQTYSYWNTWQATVANSGC